MPQEILSVQPGELKFIFEVRKQSSCSLQFTNTTDNYVAFKVKTTAPKKYIVRPTTGIISPRGTTDVTVTLQGQSEAPPNMECRDKFLVQSVLFPDGAQQGEIPPDLFNKEKEVFGSTLKVVYVSPPQPPPVSDSAAEDVLPSSSRNLDSVDGHIVDVGKDPVELKTKLAEEQSQVKRLIEEREVALQKTQQLQEEKEAALQKTWQLQEEKEAALQKTQRLQEEKEVALQQNQELQKEITAMAARSGERSISTVQHKPILGFSSLLLLAVALLGILLGYLFRQTVAIVF